MSFGCKARGWRKEELYTVTSGLVGVFNVGVIICCSLSLLKFQWSWSASTSHNSFLGCLVEVLDRYNSLFTIKMNFSFINGCLIKYYHWYTLLYDSKTMWGRRGGSPTLSSFFRLSRLALDSWKESVEHLQVMFYFWLILQWCKTHNTMYMNALKLCLQY